MNQCKYVCATWIIACSCPLGTANVRDFARDYNPLAENLAGSDGDAGSEIKTWENAAANDGLAGSIMNKDSLRPQDAN